MAFRNYYKPYCFQGLLTTPAANNWDVDLCSLTPPNQGELSEPHRAYIENYLVGHPPYRNNKENGLKPDVLEVINIGSTASWGLIDLMPERLQLMN